MCLEPYNHCDYKVTIIVSNNVQTLKVQSIASYKVSTLKDIDRSYTFFLSMKVPCCFE